MAQPEAEAHGLSNPFFQEQICLKMLSPRAAPLRTFKTLLGNLAPEVQNKNCIPGGIWHEKIQQTGGPASLLGSLALLCPTLRPSFVLISSTSFLPRKLLSLGWRHLIISSSILLKNFFFCSYIPNNKMAQTLNSVAENLFRENKPIRHHVIREFQDGRDKRCAESRYLFPVYLSRCSLSCWWAFLFLFTLGRGRWLLSKPHSLAFLFSSCFQLKAS